MPLNLKNKISVIVPVYNVEKYIEKCISSIKKQSYNNFEVIIINDGSIDKSIEKILPLIENDYRFKIITQKNSGLSAARNKGIEHATGEYISFIDSDDHIHNDFLQDMMNKITQTHSDICVCDVQTVDEDGNKIRYLKQHINPENNSLDIYHVFLESVAVLPSAWNKIFKKEIVNETKFPVGRYFEDIAIMHQIILNSKKICYINKPLYNYVIRKNSITQTQNEKYLIDRFWVTEYIRNYLEKNKTYNKYEKNYATLYLAHLVVPLIIYLVNNPTINSIKIKKEINIDIYNFKNIISLLRKRTKLSFLLLMFKLTPKLTINILRIIKNANN
ncbi:glycosyltransferase family 2 protein [Xenorhabdus miraniensis]|uniref:Ss-1,4-galactosyltransferase n=1 Tax=Xenorhabdus miraniensis TaxID=351674 RepID=A0A2D0JLP0_9GAMM|nr:glycosyltransferase [Xenorhabdus miraniensis]PHM47217.1 ss-1,4-galactosyltransferase [Xenorhabdus miraniensis]